MRNGLLREYTKRHKEIINKRKTKQKESILKIKIIYPTLAISHNSSVISVLKNKFKVRIEETKYRINGLDLLVWKVSGPEDNLKQIYSLLIFSRFTKLDGFFDEKSWKQEIKELEKQAVIQKKSVIPY